MIDQDVYARRTPPVVKNIYAIRHIASKDTILEFDSHYLAWRWLEYNMTDPVALARYDIITCRETSTRTDWTPVD